MPREDLVDDDLPEGRLDQPHGGDGPAKVAGLAVRGTLSSLMTDNGGTEGMPEDALRHGMFVVELPTLPPDAHGKSDAHNQERMFQLRREFLKAKATAAYAWIPQAVEAYRRGQKSDFLPDLGVIRAIGVSAASDSAKIITQSTDAGAFGFDLKLSELASYSLELMLGEAEKAEPVPAFHYSGEMEATIGALSPSAQLRWDLITRAAYLQVRGDHNFAAQPVSNSISALDGKLEGVGVFRKDRSRFSLVKVIEADVPMTRHEQELMTQISKLPNLHRDDPRVKTLLDLSDGLFYFLRDFSEAQGTASYLRDRLHAAFGKDTPISLFNKLSDLYVESEKVKADLQDVTKAVREEIYKAKVTFSADNPFELTKLSDPMAARLKDILTRYAQVLENLQIFITKNKSALNQAVLGHNHKPKSKDNASLPADLIAKRDHYDAQQHAETKGKLTTGLGKIGESTIAFDAVIRGALTDGQDKE